MKRLYYVLISLLLFSCTVDNTIDIKDYPFITTIDELSEMYSFPIDTSGDFVTASLTKILGGGLEIEYTYDNLDVVSDFPLLYTIAASKETSAKEAMQAYFVLKQTVKLVMNTGGQSYKEINTLDLPGDRSYYAVRYYENQENGIFFIMQKDRFVYHILTSGVIFDDHGLLINAILPDLKDLNDFHFKK